MERQGHLGGPNTPPLAESGRTPSDETLITDARAGVTPAQMVERKVLSLLGEGQLPVSWLRTARLRRPPG
jgi:hypothetical protein